MALACGYAFRTLVPRALTEEIMQVLERLMYIGPNRRSEKTVAEWLLEISPAEQVALQAAKGSCLSALSARAAELGLTLENELGEGLSFPDELPVTHWLCHLAASLALAIQQKAGHRVMFGAVVPAHQDSRCRFVFEYEHGDSGADAGEIALRLLAEAIPGVVWEADPEVPGTDAVSALNSYLPRAARHVLPRDSAALVTAAADLDVPCVKLEREPYGDFSGEFRIRPEGLLKFGHSCYQHIVDGTLCIDRNADLVPLIFDREKVFECLLSLRVPTARQDMEFRNLLTAKRAIRAAERVGFPVMLKGVTRQRARQGSSATVFGPLHSADAVQSAFEQCREQSSRVLVEKFAEGRILHLLLANHAPVCVLDADAGVIAAEQIHPSIIDLAIRVSRSLKAGLLRITVATPDLTRSLEESRGAVLDLDPAPQLDRWFADGSARMKEVAEGYLRWLYPEGAPSRIPLIAVTGTNGKTTTSRMIANVLKAAGFRPGLATTRGIFLNEKLRQAGDLAGTEGHHLVFESREVDAAVLETARGGVVSAGFMFDWCDVAVCLNVAPDHIGSYGVETLAEMTAVKRSVLERARRAVVLNADYETCRGMLPFANGVAVYLASVESTASAVRAIAAGAWLCVVEEEAGQQYIVLHSPDGSRTAIMPVADIPATLGGAARFNISNAQHAICASHAGGMALDLIRATLHRFDSTFENNPGRLNIFRELPFTVILDYAHNADGMHRIGEVLSQLDVKGRKIVMCAVTGNRTPVELAALCHAVRPHFDHFVCRCYPGARGMLWPEVPGLMKAVLMEDGVAAENITVVDVPEQGALTTLRLARPGDLVLLCPGSRDIDEIWETIVSFKPDF